MNALPIPDEVFELDLRYIADACCDEGALVYEHDLPKLITELENRIGEPPTEDQVIEYAIRDYRERLDDEAASQAKYSTRGF